jgi:hypothetical protein
MPTRVRQSDQQRGHLLDPQFCLVRVNVRARGVDPTNARRRSRRLVQSLVVRGPVVDAAQRAGVEPIELMSALAPLLHQVGLRSTGEVLRMSE